MIRSSYTLLNWSMRVPHRFLLSAVRKASRNFLFRSLPLHIRCWWIGLWSTSSKFLLGKGGAASWMKKESWVRTRAGMICIAGRYIIEVEWPIIDRVRGTKLDCLISPPLPNIYIYADVCIINPVFSQYASHPLIKWRKRDPAERMHGVMIRTISGFGHVQKTNKYIWNWMDINFSLSFLYSSPVRESSYTYTSEAQLIHHLRSPPPSCWWCPLLP